ncbi:MAG: rod shape-determining protein [Pyrinomonadaceae bacterium]
MSIMASFFTRHLAIDLGTVNTLIYAPGRGIVLNEPSAVALSKYTGEVLAVGTEAYGLLGREPHDTDVICPVRGGTITNFDAVQKMLTAFIKRVQGIQNRRSHLIIGVPGSSTLLEQRAVRDAGRDVKAKRVDLVNEGLAAAFGTGCDLYDGRAHLVVDIGGGTTNIAIVSGGAIVSSKSLRAAGIAMDEAIRDYVREKYELQLGDQTAERVKRELLSINGVEKEVRRVEVVGKNLTDGLAKAVELTSDRARKAIEPIVAEIVTGVRRAIEESKPDTTSDIYQTGLILTGGGALLDGIAERLQKELRLHVVTAENPLATVALGAGLLLMDEEKLNRVAIRDDVPVWQMSDELVVNW